MKIIEFTCGTSLVGSNEYSIGYKKLKLNY